MALRVRPIRGSFVRGSWMVSAIVLTAVVSGPCAQPALANHGQPLHERKHDAKRQVEALEEQWRQAELTDDVDVMDKLLSDDYIGISMTGQVNTKVQQLDRMRMHKIVLTKIDLGEMQVKLVGSIAIVTSRAEVEGTNDGTPIKGIYRYTRVYQRLPTGAWKITSFEATRVPGLGDRGPNGRGNSKAVANLPPAGPS
jgi:ketosteroid isomerase-like protein